MRETSGDAGLDWAGYIGMTEAAAILPSHPNRSTVWRWTHDGYRCRNGISVRLQTSRCGKQLFTRREWLAEFVKRINENERAHEVEQNPRKRDHYADAAALRARFARTGRKLARQVSARA